ncbi:MAG: hypothetical protein M5R40_09155 [Anaerolineae bacterium]|nr:hypothetical protein [Anaerolineae bacterium]
MPEAVRGAFDALLAGGDYRAVANPMAADLRVDLEGGNAPIGALWVYAVVAPFPTLADALAWEDVLRFWRGAPDALAYIANSGGPPTLVVTADVLATLTALLGPPGPRRAGPGCGGRRGAVHGVGAVRRLVVGCAVRRAPPGVEGPRRRWRQPARPRRRPGRLPA